VICLIRPDGKMQWNKLPAKAILSSARNGEIDISRLEWDDSDRRVDLDTLRLAFRYGEACPGGLLVAGQAISEVGRPSELRQTHRDAPNALNKYQENQGPLIEQVMPGSAEYLRHLNASIDANVAKEIEESALDIISDIEGREPRLDLIKHWKSLGGSVPNPH
jgi:hypothetical protein